MRPASSFVEGEGEGATNICEAGSGEPKAGQSHSAALLADGGFKAWLQLSPFRHNLLTAYRC
jgi:hypothetical protein